jgi:hypothetical protein
MTRDPYERLLLDGYVDGLDAPDDDIARAVEALALSADPRDGVKVTRDSMGEDDFTDDEIVAHVEQMLGA